MKIVVTGASGFVGRALVAELERSGHSVQGLRRSDLDLASGESAIAERIAPLEPDVVVQLAARVGVAACEADPVDAVRANVTAAALVARTCARLGVRLAYASTADVYGEQEETCIESTPVRPPRSLYSATKWWGEQAARLYAARGLQVLRITHPYGPGVEPGRGGGTIPTLLEQAAARRPIVVWRGDARSWCHVDDVARAIRAVLERGERATTAEAASAGEGVFNIATGVEPIPTLEVARRACKLTGAGEELIEEVDAPGPASARVSAEKLCRLGWEAEIELETGMRELLEELRPRSADDRTRGQAGAAAR